MLHGARRRFFPHDKYRSELTELRDQFKTRISAAAHQPD